MRHGKRLVVLLASLAAGIAAKGQAPVKLPGGDARFKADILVVVAHPDDEGAVTPYLARAIYDQHKSVAVVFGTRGDSGGNEAGRERARALGDIREMEARAACAKLGIGNVWFLHGRDTASQNVLNSLASWGHGANLENLVEIFRLTRPEVVMTWLPGVFIGENHGDHQAAGVLATEAFDLAGDPTAFPEQLAGASKRLEPYLDELQPWQPKKLYYFNDAADQKLFADAGPAYSVRDISPSQKKPYWRLALEAVKPHRTQFGGFLADIDKMNDAGLEKLIDDPDAGWSDPQVLLFGKSVTGQKIWDPVFPESEPAAVAPKRSVSTYSGPQLVSAEGPLELELAGPWRFYRKFCLAHKVDNHSIGRDAELGVSKGSILSIPLVVTRKEGAGREINLKVSAPEGWKVLRGEGAFTLPDEPETAIRVEVQTPEIPEKELRGRVPDVLGVTGTSGGKPFGNVTLKVLLRATALPE